MVLESPAAFFFLPSLHFTQDFVGLIQYGKKGGILPKDLSPLEKNIWEDLRWLGVIWNREGIIRNPPRKIFVDREPEIK